MLINHDEIETRTRKLPMISKQSGEHLYSIVDIVSKWTFLIIQLINWKGYKSYSVIK